MDTVLMPGITLSFRRSRNNPRRTPSKAMIEALRHLAECEEMEPFISDAHGRGRDVMVAVHHATVDGHPILIHVAAIQRRKDPLT